MAGVLDHKADVVLTGKVDSSNDLIAGGDIHRVTGKVAQSAGLRLGGERITSLVGKVHLHDRRGRI